MIENSKKLGSYINSNYLKTAYAFEGSVKEIFHRGRWIKTKKLTITLDEQEAQQHKDYHLALGDEINWWACISDDLPKDKMIKCSDGIYIWKETWNWDRTGSDITSCGYIKI